MKKTLLFLGLSLMALFGFAQQMSGTYTINASSPASGTNFQTFSAAFSQLTTSGVNGPVTINVVQGTYTEQIYLYYVSIPGASEINTVTVQSAPSNTAMPVVQYSTYPIYWYYSDLSYLTIKGLNFKTTGSSYVAYMYYGIYTEVTFRDNKFDGTNIATTSNAYSVIYRYYGTSNGFRFINNEINEGSYGMYIYYQQGSEMQIDSNTIVGASYYGIYQYYTYSPYMPVSISNNTVDVDGYTTTYGIYSYYAGGGSKIDGNNVNVSSSNVSSTIYGLTGYYTGYSANNNNRATISNNMVVTEGTGTHYAMYVYYTGYTDVVHNSVRSNGNSGYAIYYYNAGNSSVYGYNTCYNNIFTTASTNPYTFYLYHPYNWIGGGNNLFWNGTGMYNYWYTGGTAAYTYDIPTFELYSLTSGNKMLNPGFFSTTDLHLFTPALDGSGANVGLDYDIDGDFRVMSSPDMGADEFGVDHNAQPIALISPNNPICADDTCLTAVIANTGILNLTSVNIHWTFNGGSVITVPWTGNMSPGQMDTITLTCNIQFSDGDSVAVYTSLPNGQVDLLSLNDTLSSSTYDGLAGIYNIPGDYPTLTAAAADANLRGVCEAVVMNIAPGTYNEQILLRNIPGVSSTKTITWKSSTDNAEDVLIQFAGTSTNYNVITLNQTDWQIFENLTVHNTSPSYARTFELVGNANNNVIRNNTTRGIYSTSTAVNYYNIFLNGENLNNVIDNNHIIAGGVGIAAVAGGGNYNTKMTHNNIDDWGYYGIYNYYFGGTEIADNRVVNDTTNGVCYMGIYNYYSPGTDIDRNYVSAPYSTYGIGYGMYNYLSPGTSANRVSYSNNCVISGKPDYTGYGYYGMYVYGGYIDIEGNTITKNGGSPSTNYTSLYINTGGALKLKNNNLVNFASPYAMYSSSEYTIVESDYNNFYTTNGALIYNQNIYNDLATYQTATGFDLNSYMVNPMFADTVACATCSEVLDGTGTTTANYADVDVNNNQRNATNPDIGAVEFLIAETFGLGSDSTYCMDQLVFDASPATGVTWSVNGTAITGSSLTLEAGNQATNFEILVFVTTEFCGNKSDVASIVLVPNAQLDNSVHICDGASTILNPGGSPTGSYSWSNGATTQAIMVSTPGYFTVTKTEQGCVSQASSIVTQSDAVEFASTEVCQDALPLQLDATIYGGIAYAWTGGSTPTSSTNTFNTAGPYSVTATDNMGCQSVADFIVNVLQAPNAVISTPTASGNIYMFDASTSNYLTSNSTVNWSFGSVALPAFSTNVSEVVTYPWSNPSSPSSYVVTLEINNGCGIDVATKVVKPDPLGMEERSNSTLSVYPNPAQDVLNITTVDPTAGSIQILDMSGRIVYSNLVTEASQTHFIDISSLSSGTYTLRFVQSDNTMVQPIIVQ